MKNPQLMNEPELYKIQVAAHLSTNWTARFEGLSMRQLPEGATLLSGRLDQSALHGVLASIRDLGLKLISVEKVEET